MPNGTGGLRRQLPFAPCLLFTVAVGIASACSTMTSPTNVTQDRAIEIARQQISFEPTSTSAAMDTRQSRPVWVVTFRCADGSHGGLGQFAEVAIDRRNGEVVTVAMS